MIGVELFLTPAGTARSEDPGLSAAREAAGDVPAGKQKRRSGNQWYIRFSIFPPTNILLILFEVSDEKAFLWTLLVDLLKL